MSADKSYEQLQQENADLQARLAEAEGTLRAIHSGEVDALVVCTARGNQIYTLDNADRPYRLLVEEMQQGAATVSRDGAILYCNRRFAAMFGHSPDQVLSHPIEFYFAADERKRLETFLQAAAFHGSSHDEFNCHSETRQVVPVFVSANYLLLDQTPVICLIVADLSEQKVADQRASELRLEKQRTKVLADFVRDTSHDLRTPISAILSGLYLLQRIEDETRRIQKLRDIENEVLYLNRVLEQFQQMAVLDSLTELTLQQRDVSEIVLGAVSAVRTKTQDTRQITTSTPAEGDPVLVQCQPDMLHRALVELLHNAIQFTQSGGHIQVRVQVPNHRQLTIEVEDDGSGIPPAHLPHIMRRFYKVSEARSMTGGAGLGLPMVKRIIELHHGLLEAESTPGIRTIFRIVLPAAAPDAEHPGIA